MPAHVVVDPGQSDGLADVAAAHDDEDCKVLNAYGEAGLVEQ